MRAERVKQWWPLIALMLVASLTACSSGEPSEDPTSASPEPSESESETAEALEEIVFALPSDMTALDPQVSTTFWVKVVYYDNVSERLVALNSDGEPEGQLAESYEMIDDDTWRIKLHEGVTFHNGEPFNSEAAIFSLERAMSEELGASQRGFLLDMKSFEAVDEHTFDIHTDGPAPFLDFVALPVIPMVPPEYTASDPEALQKKGIGTGPYLMDSVSDDEVVLVKNHDYWRGDPTGPERVRIVARPEDSTRVAGLQAGEIDVIVDVPPELMGQVPNSETVPMLRGHQLLLNGFRAPTDNPKIREAIVKAIDKDGIREGVYGETGAPANCQFVDEGSLGYVSGPRLTSPQPYDPGQARKLLEEAGAVGTKIDLLVSVGGYPGGEETAEVALEQLKAAGFDARLISEDFQTFLKTAQSAAEGRPQVIHIGANFTHGIVQPWGFWLNPESKYFNFRYDQYPGLEEKIATARTTLDEAERQRLFAEIAETVCDSNFYVFLLRQTASFGFRDGISFPARGDEIFPFTAVAPE